MQSERYVAVDNVCAWPNLTPLADGSLIATIFNQPTHGGWEGDVECWRSEDDGRSWKRHGIPAPHEPGTNRMNVAAGCAPDGTMIVLASGWSKRNPIGNYSSPLEGKVLPTWVCRSADGGRTWSQSEGVEIPPKTAGKGIVPFGDIVILPDNTLGVSMYGWTENNDFGAWFHVSSDNGKTWKFKGAIRTTDASETTLLTLPDGNLLAAARTRRDQHLDILRSEDGGETWNLLGPATLGHQHPGHLLQLRDGRLLLTYGIRNKGLYGVGARFSPDNGKTWNAPIVLVDFQIATDGGYPATTEAGDGTLITAYYCNGVPAHQRYHMGIVRWNPDN